VLVVSVTGAVLLDGAVVVVDVSPVVVLDGTYGVYDSPGQDKKMLCLAGSVAAATVAKATGRDSISKTTGTPSPKTRAHVTASERFTTFPSKR